MNTTEKTVSNISEKTSLNQETEPKPKTQETLKTPNTEIKSKTHKKSLSEIIKKLKEKRSAKKEKKQKREYEKIKKMQEESDERFEYKFNKIINEPHFQTQGMGYAKVSTIPHFLLTNGFKFILAILILQHAANIGLNKLIKDSMPIKQGTVVQQMVTPLETIYGIDFDENPETIESLLYLNNKEDALMNDKIKIGTKINMKSYMKETSKSVYIIDNVIVKQR